MPRDWKKLAHAGGGEQWIGAFLSGPVMPPALRPNRGPMAEPTSPFQIADFRFYWAARLASTIAQMIMVIVIGWQVYDIARATMSSRRPRSSSA